MHFIQNLYKDNINRYSLHSICWITIGTIIFIVLFYIVLVIGAEIQGGTAGDSAGWTFIIATPAVIIPSGFITALYQFQYLRKKEKQHSNFRIKNIFITQNIFYIMFSLITTVLYFWGIYSSILFIHYEPFLVIFIIPFIILVLLINFLISKFILDKIIDKKFG